MIRCLGLVAGLLLVVMEPWIVDWLSISAVLREEALAGILVLSIALPFVPLLAGWCGVLEVYG